MLHSAFESLSSTFPDALQITSWTILFVFIWLFKYSCINKDFSFFHIIFIKNTKIVILQTVRHPKTHLNVWTVVAKRINTFRVWFIVRLKGHVIHFQTHYQSFKMNAWLWIYGTFSKIPPLINTHHGTLHVFMGREILWQMKMERTYSNLRLREGALDKYSVTCSIVP